VHVLEIDALEIGVPDLGGLERPNEPPLPRDAGSRARLLVLRPRRNDSTRARPSRVAHSACRLAAAGAARRKSVPARVLPLARRVGADAGRPVSGGSKRSSGLATTRTHGGNAPRTIRCARCPPSAGGAAGAGVGDPACRVRAGTGAASVGSKRGGRSTRRETDRGSPSARRRRPGSVAPAAPRTR
jgi:hypothetical protein